MMNRLWIGLSAGLLLGLAVMPAAHAAPAPVDITAILAAPDRDDADRKQDETRQPEKLLAFIGVRAPMSILDLMAGGGYTTELLARAVGPTGKVYAEVPADMPDKVKAKLDQRLTKPVLANVVKLETPVDAPVPAGTPKLDVVTFILNYHDTTYMTVDRARMNKAVFDALKKGGLFIVVDHAAKAGDGITVGKSLHRIEESVVKKEVEAAGFKLAGEADFLRHPDDPKDKAFYDMKSPTDQFVLKFKKPV